MRVLRRAFRGKAVVLRKQAPARARPQGRTPQLQVVAIQASEDSDVGSGSTFSKHIRVPSCTLPIIANRFWMLGDTLRSTRGLWSTRYYTSGQRFPLLFWN